MSTAALFVEAVDTALALADTVWQWLIVLATVAAILLLAAIATSAWAVDAAWEWLHGRLWGAGGPDEETEPGEAPEGPHAHSAPRVPSWVNTDHHDDLEEAA